MGDNLNKIKEILEQAKEAIAKSAKDDLDEKIRAKLKAEMDKRKFSEVDATKHIIDRDRGDKIAEVPKSKKEPLLQSEQEVCKVDSNGQWKIEKSNYGPKHMKLYDPNVNAERKSNNTGDQVRNAGKNVNTKAYTTIGSATETARLKAEAKRRKKNPAPVKTLKDMSPEERTAIENKYGTKIKDDKE